MIIFNKYMNNCLVFIQTVNQLCVITLVFVIHCRTYLIYTPIYIYSFIYIVIVKLPPTSLFPNTSTNFYIIVYTNIIISIHSAFFITQSITTIGSVPFTDSGASNPNITMPYLIIGVTLIISFATTFVHHTLSSSHNELINICYTYYKHSSNSYGSSNNKYLTKKIILRYRVYLCILAIMLALLVGTLYYNGREGWGYLNSFYFSIGTMTTLGYGERGS